MADNVLFSYQGGLNLFKSLEGRSVCISHRSEGWPTGEPHSLVDPTRRICVSRRGVGRVERINQDRLFGNANAEADALSEAALGWQRRLRATLARGSSK